jgi:uncharacterized membrane protein YhaH (DUF805 family)
MSGRLSRHDKKIQKLQNRGYAKIKSMNYYIEVLKKYAIFDGRARRKEYWMFVLWNLIITAVLYFVAAVIVTSTNSQAGNILVDLYSFAVLIPGIAVSVRRLHDIGKSGWWFFLAFIPLIGAIILIVWAIQDSKPGNNQYGPNPKSASSVVVPAA